MIEYTTMEEEIVKWIQCDNKLKEYNEKIKVLRDHKDVLSGHIFDHYEIHSKTKDQHPEFNVTALDTRLGFHTSNNYESLNYKFLKECLHEYFSSEEKAQELISFIRNKRKKEEKISLKRLATETKAS